MNKIDLNSASLCNVEKLSEAKIMGNKLKQKTGASRVQLEKVKQDVPAVTGVVLNWYGWGNLSFYVLMPHQPIR